MQHLDLILLEIDAIAQIYSEKCQEMVFEITLKIIELMNKAHQQEIEL